MTSEPATANAQRRAIAHVTALADGGRIDPTLRVTVNFHPDRIAGDGFVLEAMARDGIYRSQFETGTSNGGLTAHPGGDRWSWESRIFGGAYDHVPAAERPKYGSLNYRRRGTGGSPRFGSAHLRLTSSALARTTFCYPDSVFEPTKFGVADRMSLVQLAETDDKDPLDDYIEAQVHGPLFLDRDVEALVLDPCFQETKVEQAARTLPCPIEWHGGFRLSTEELRRHPEYRGAHYAELGTSLARNGFLDPSMIGRAAQSGCYDEQALKRVWHYLARFGSPPDQASLRRNVLRYPLGETPTAACRCCRSEAAVPKPASAATLSTDRSVASSNSQARSTRCRANHSPGEIPISSRNLRVNVLTLIESRAASSFNVTGR